MEALTCGLPVLATPVGGIPELIVDGETGWLASAADFPARILQLLQEPPRLQEMRQRLVTGRGDLDVRCRAREAVEYLREVLS